jgi:hypothetical protein
MYDSEWWEFGRRTKEEHGDVREHYLRVVAWYGIMHHNCSEEELGITDIIAVIINS